MEHSSSTFHDFPDLNHENEVGGENDHEEQIFGEPLIFNDEDDNLAAANEVQRANLTLEEAEKRLEIGKVVANEHIAFALYNKYANLKGFSVKKGRNYPFKDGSGLQGKLFHCSCEGVKDNKRSRDRVPQFLKTSFRCGCKAKLKIGRRKGDVWKVTSFYKEHSHDLYPPDQTYLLRASRNVTDEQELLITSLLKAKIPVSNAFNFLEAAAQGRENVGFLLQDAFNSVYRAKRKTKTDKGDTRELMDHFMDKSNNEFDYFWRAETDDDDRLMNFFCRDYRCLIDFECFGDLLSFDTTYRTNKYGLICAPFIGINHHRDNILFGFALLSDETQISFEWLFKMFLKSMRGKQPKIIFTDQCQAMMNAIETVFPDAHHRLCQWHIDQNAPSHFGSLNGDSNFKQLWANCMTYCESEDEFEKTWKEMMDYDIPEENQNWFEVMYKLRRRWATTFSNHIFSAGLLTTSRSEGTNSAFKKLIGNCTSSLMDCVTGYEELQERWCRKEKEKDTLCQHNKPTPFVSSNPLLKHAADVYTFSVFQLFEKELKDTMGLELPQQIASSGSPLVFFQVKSYDNSRSRIIECDTRELKIKCSCHKFETVGILCSHALKVLDYVKIHCIPDNYIKKRWTKVAKGGAYVDTSVGGSGKDSTCSVNSYVYQMAFVNHSTKEVRDIAMRGKAHKETRDILSKHIECVKKEINAWIENMSLNDLNACNGVAANKDNNYLVKDPLPAKSRGINNVQRSHWDVKSKRGKRKAGNSKLTGKAVQRKGQHSQTVRGDSPFHSTADFGYSQVVKNVQLPIISMHSVVGDIGGQSNMGMSEYVANAYPFGTFNMGMHTSQDWRPSN